MAGPIFPSKWAKEKAPCCGEPWEVGDPLCYNDDGIVVHANCANLSIVHVEPYKGKKETVCPKCFLTSCDCE